MDRSFCVRDWNPEHVINWMSGLDKCFDEYIPIFRREHITGEKLLSLTSEILTSYDIAKVGHQIILLDSVEFLRVLQHNIENETLQFNVLRVCRHASAVHECVLAIESLQVTAEESSVDEDSNKRFFKSFEGDKKRLNAELCSCTLQLMEATKHVVAWLDRAPFSTITECEQLRKDIVVHSFDINTSVQVYLARAQGSQTVKQNVKVALQTQSAKLRDLCRKFVRTAREPLIFTPCTVENVHISKKETEDLGLLFRSSDNSDYHVIHSVQSRSPAEKTCRVDEGDEIVQVNDKTVVGWQHYKVVEEIRSDPTRVVLLLRKRPSHVTDYPGAPTRRKPMSRPRNQFIMKRRPGAISGPEIPPPPPMNRQMSAQGPDEVFAKPGPVELDPKGSPALQTKAGTAPPSVSSERSRHMMDFITVAEDEDMNSAVGVGSGRRALPSDSLSIASSRSEYGSVVLRPKTKPKGSTTRRISCKDLGQGDCQGWLYRKRSTAITTLWVKRWCVIKNNSLYYYRYIEDQHAEGLINLRGFVISPVAEIKSGRYAFRIYNDYNTITFASESEQDRSKWMNKLGLAAIGYDTSRLQQMGGFAPGFVSPPPNPSVTNGFSESDDSSDDGTGPPVELRGSSSASSSTSSSSNSAVQMAQRVSSFYPELSTIDEEERRHSSLVRTLREVKRMERIITDKKQQVQLIDDFLKDPANITSDILRQFMQEYAYIFNND